MQMQSLEDKHGKPESIWLRTAPIYDISWFHENSGGKTMLKYLRLTCTEAKCCFRLSFNYRLDPDGLPEDISFPKATEGGTRLSHFFPPH